MSFPFEPIVSRSLCLLSLGLASGCGGAGPEWVDLTVGFRPALSSAVLAEGAPVGISTDAGGTWLMTQLAPEDWEPAAWPGVWRTARPSTAVGSPDVGANTRLVVGGKSWALIPAHASLAIAAAAVDLKGLPRDTFATFGDLLFVLPAAPGRPPASTYSSFVDLGSEVDGAWRIVSEGFAANGVPVLSGTRQVVPVDVPRRSVLRFRTLVMGAPGGEALLTIRAGDRLLFEHHQATELVGAIESHVVALPEGPVELSFKCAGPPAFAAFLGPRVGPAEVGTFGARPWGAARPDLVVFLADTLRADRLTAYGGRGLTPHLDRLAEHSVVFTEARSSSSWTLPSHASLFSGLHPPQHGVVSHGDHLEPAAVTIAESLREAGYRTIAVTERGWVVPEFGLDQGFETFEHRAGFETTLERATALAAEDDGRPLFLFVHTYRAHAPYAVSDEVRAELGIQEDWFAVDARLRPVVEDWTSREELLPDVRSSIGLLRQLYDGAVVELDRGFDTLFGRLERMGVLGEDDYLILLSDHGEILGEHDSIWHGFGVWDELTRVPLLVYSPALAPRTSAAPASHVDVAPTIAQLLGTRVDPSWVGRSLFAAPRPGELHAVLSYACSEESPSPMALFDGTRKVVMRTREDSADEPEVMRAFDLAADPHETAGTQLSREEVEELLRRWRVHMDTADTRLLTPGNVVLTEERLAELRDLGYL